MNIGDTSSLKDENKMDSNKVWQWRIMHAKKYSITPEPFHYSNEIGLNFNVASNTQKKLDLDLVTNGVMLEVCDFAKTVIKGKGHFITQILENNFDLGLENEQHRVDFTAQILHKVKDLIRKPPKDKHEVFILFDKPSNLEYTNNSDNGLHMACRESKTENFLVEMDDTDDSEEEDGFNSQATSREYMTENLSDFESDESKQKCSGPQATTELKEVLPSSFPYCEEIGLSLDIGSKQSLDIGLFTKGVMLELVHFTRVLTASYNRIILDVLEHNFELDLKNEQVKNQILFKVSHLLKRRKRLNTTGNTTTPEFKNEPFAFQTNPFKVPRGSSLSNKQEMSAHLTTSEQGPEEHRQGQSKHMDTNTLSHETISCTSRKTEGDHSDTYAQEESALDSDNQGLLKHPKYTDILQESESSCLTTTDISSTLPIVNTIVNPPFESLPDKRGFCGDEEETQTPRSGLNKSDIEQEEMGTEHNIWKLRSNRVEQILSTMGIEFGQFNRSKTVGLEYNVGFGQKQNISVDSLKNPLLFEIGKFAVAINSSQKDFIMEILEYNFDLNLPSQHHRNIFASDIMTRVRQLRSCGDAVKFSNEVFELPGLVASVNKTAQSDGGVNPELGISKMGKCDVSPVCPPDSHAETKEHISCRSGDLYPLCKEIGLNLHVNNSQPNKKLEINKLTNGAMTEVTNFAEKLCGTFEQICLDILRHNLDFDLQRDSELAKNILAKIYALIDQMKQKVATKSKISVHVRHAIKMSTMEKQDCPDNPNLDTCSAGTSQAAVTDQNVCSADTEHQNDLDLKLWKLRDNYVQQILSMPHREYCPFYSYSRCRKLGIDFNVGSGVKQNLDPKLLTNGIMVELNRFAIELCSAQKHFITEILEYNFDLHFENELCRSAFAKKVMWKFGAAKSQSRRGCMKTLQRLPFELPDTNIKEPLQLILPCPKCYQDQNHEVLKDNADSVHKHHPHPSTMTETDSTEVNCTAQQPTEDPSSTFFTVEERIMESYPLCKKSGLNLFVDKDKPIKKLDTQVLTYGILRELASFARKLCGTKKVIVDILKHNFNILHQYLNPAEVSSSAFQRKITDPDWFNEVFVIPTPRRPRQLKRAPAIQESNCLESIKKRKLALHSSQSQRQSQSQSPTVIKSKPNYSICYPICSEIGLDLDVTSKSEEKEKLDLNLLTRAVVAEIHKNLTTKVRHYYPRTLFEILDYNFDLSSQHHRRWEFSLATASKFQSIAKLYRKNKDRPDEVFKLPFVFEEGEKTKRRKRSQEKPVKKRTEGSCAREVGHHSDVNHVNLLSGVQTKEEPCSHDEDTKSSIDHWAMNIQNPGLVNVGCGSPLQENIQIKKEEYDPHYDKPELDTEEKYHPQHVDVKAELNICGVEHLISCEPAGGSLGNTVNQNHRTSTDIPRESESCLLVSCATFPTPTDVSSTLPTTNTNVNPPFTRGTDERELCGGEEQTQTPRNVLDKCAIKHREMETEHNMWKFRANRVEQILSTLKTERSAFLSGKISLEFNVGFGQKQNIGVDSLTDGVLLEIAKFALAMNLSQKDFIIEILEYNFDLNLPSQHHRNIFTCEIIDRVRQLRSCEDAVKISNKIFELPSPSINMVAQSVDGVSPKLTSTPRMEKFDVSPVCPPDSHAETKEHISCRSGDLYPLCKEIGLNLHVNNSQSNKKLEINKLTNGAMTEVASFAEKLCGTFEQICLDILRHNLDFDLQRDSELAKNIFARISALIEQRNLSTFPETSKNIKLTMNDMSTMEKQDCPDNPNLDTCTAGSPQAAVIDQNVCSSADTEHQNDLNLMLWKLRANHVQRILSVPHEEHCPLDPYSRCKKLGIDFNVGSGIKQKFDPKLLTNGIMVELMTFSRTLLSSQKYFITEILEHNFDLHFENELSRSAFADKVMIRIKSERVHKRILCKRQRQMKKPFELPNVQCIEEPSHAKTLHCPKCYQDQKFHEDESDTGHMHHPRPHTMSDTVSADVKCTTQKHAKDASSIFSTTKETIMDSNPHCKKIGLDLCVDKDLPKDKLDMRVLTNSVMAEVARFAKKICGTNNVIINDVLEYNFNIGKQSLDLNPAVMFNREIRQKDRGPAWFNKVFVIQTYSSNVKVNWESALHRGERMENIKKRQLALQTKQKNHRSRGNCYPVCTAIGLDLDKRAISGKKIKLDLKLLTRAVVLEIHKFATLQAVNYYPRTVFDILDYNFDVSSQHYRRWEFSIATASKIQTMVKEYCREDDNIEDADVVFKLPFMFDPETSQQEKRQNNKSVNSSMDTANEPNSSCLDIHTHFITSTNVLSSLPTVNSNETSKIGNQADERGFYGDEEQTQTPSNAPNECDMEQEEMRTENYYTCPLGESDLESDEVSDSENTGNQNHLQNPESFSPSSDIVSESESSCMGIHAPFFTSTDVSSTLPNVNSNINPPFSSQPDKKWFCGAEEATQIPINSPNKSDMEQEEMGIENYYTCPLGESDLESDEVSDSENTGNQNHLENPEGFSPSSDIVSESESSSMGIHAPFFTSTDVSSTLPNVNSNINPPFSSQPDKKWFGGAEEATQTLRNSPNKSDMEQEEMGTEHKKNILARIPAIMEQSDLSAVTKMCKNKNLTMDDISTMEKTDCPNNLNLDTCSAGSSQAAVIVQSVGSSADTEHQNYLGLKMWKLRANHIQRILSVPHEEHCPLDPYSRCKKLGIDFNVGSGIKQKFDPKLLTNGIMVELSTFATELLSSQKYFITEILEHNFDLHFENELSRSAFADEVMMRIKRERVHKRNLFTRQNLMKKPFELPDVQCIEEPSHAKTLHCPKCYQDQKFHEDESDTGHMHHPRLHTMSETVSADVKCTTQKHAKDASSIFSTTEETIMGRNPHCKKIGLNLCVDKDLPKDKLDMRVLTNSVMMELVQFAKKLCGAKTVIINDVLEYNFNIGKQSLDLNPAERFNREKKDGGPAWFNKVFDIQSYSIRPPGYKGKENGESALNRSERLESIKNRQLALQTKQERANNINDLKLMLWKLRANHVQRILSVPHEEHCPLDPYSRCKKLGIDFNVGSGMKQKFDPKLLTNGIMVELSTFATELLSSEKYFITEILEHNFDLHFENELSRSAFADKVMIRIKRERVHKRSLCKQPDQMKKPFELPDVQCIEEPSHAKTLHCPKCHQDQKFHEDESDTGHMHHPRPHTMSGTVSADVKCTTQKHAKDASSIFSTTKETIMDSNPHCKKIGLDLCVDKDLPKDKLDMRVLTNSVMAEVVQFAKKICGTKNVMINDVLEYNFNIGKQSLDLNPAHTFFREIRQKDGGPAWFNKVFDIQSYLIRPPRCKGKINWESALNTSEHLLESIKKRQLALQTKQERTNTPSHNINVGKSKKNRRSRVNCHPACTAIGLDLDWRVNSGKKVILDLKLLTRAVVFEIHKFATLQAVNYYPRTVFDILDYNFDVSSQHYRRWEFSIATASKIQTMVKEYCREDENIEDADVVFKLPFMFDSETSQQEKRQNNKSVNSSMDTANEPNSSCLDIHTHFVTSTNLLSSLPIVNSNETSKIGNQPDERGFYGDEEQTQTPSNAPNECNMEQEEIRTESYYTCPLGESGLEPDEVSDSENTGKQNHLQNPESFSPSSDIVSELESSCMGIHAPFLTSISHQSDIVQEEMETEHNMWKLRSNRVEQILSALTNECGRFTRSKRVGLEYNVGFGPKQNISVDSLKNPLLLEIAKFAVVINSSQKDFIMEILEYNFDLNLPSQHHRNIFASDIMTRVRQLRSCGDAVKFSNEVFELPGLVASVNKTAQSEGGVNPELGISKMGKCDVSPVCPPDSHAETKEHISCRSGDLYPLCKEIGLNLHVNNSQPNKKLEINKLTNGAMTEVTNFAEKLCGTFEQICLDILRHNLDFDLQRDSEFAKNILARIPTLIEQMNLSVCSKPQKYRKRAMNDMSTMEKQDCPDNPNLDTCSAGSSQSAVIDQNVCSSADTERQNDLDLKLWKLRANHVQQILSMPHREYCPFYSYSRCRKLGIDFNVGSGVKQNLDPKLLTNGVMVELNTFATELHSAQKHFITEILEYNFDLHFENELCRSGFAKQVMQKIEAKTRLTPQKKKGNQVPFELPDTRSIQEPICGKILPCPKCYQDLNHKVLKDKFDPVHMHHPHPSTMTGTDSTEVNCTAQQPTENPSSTCFTAEERIMESYPLCKKSGLNLCVDKDKPIKKLDTQVLTYGILRELAGFARKVCRSKQVIVDILKHNFNILHQYLNPAAMAIPESKTKLTDPDWFNEVFILTTNKPRPLKRAPAIQESQCLESIKKRKLALHSSQSQSQRQSQSQSPTVIKSKPNYSICYPLCSEIGLDLDVTSKSEEKEKLDLNLLTRAVVAEIHKYLTTKVRHYYPRTLFEILDYNFNLSSQHPRRLEFSLATASKFQSIAKLYRKNKDGPDEVIRLPFVFEKRKKRSQEKPVKKRTEGSCLREVGHHSDVNHINLLSGVQTKEEPCSHDEDTKSSIDHWAMNIQNPGLVNVVYGSHLQENIQIKKEEYDPHYDKPGLDTEEKYHPQHVDVKAESNICGVEQLMPCEPSGSHEYAIITTHPNSESNIKTESENECFTESHIKTELNPAGINSIIIDEGYENVFI